MKTNRLLCVVLLWCWCMMPSVLFAMAPPADQRGPNPDACGAACGSFLFIIVAIAILNIALLVWVARDAKNRGMGSAVGWVFLILFTGVIGWIIYLFSRPGGDLIICEHCHNKKLMVTRLCPHCGNPALPGAPTPKPVAEKQGQYCAKCGHKVQPESIFCEECGNRLKNS
jgi:hypothetical protein